LLIARWSWQIEDLRAEDLNAEATKSAVGKRPLTVHHSSLCKCQPEHQSAALKNYLKENQKSLHDEIVKKTSSQVSKILCRES
jgi:hypothetical protein